MIDDTPLPPAGAESIADQPARILCVDDEPNILSSLRRLFRGQGYQVLTAESGQAGLEILEAEAVDLVISDMRMPEMDGARFLECVRAKWPDTVRLLLTGYSDIQSILAAINRGEIYRYITKPWDDNDILLVVRHALERKVLEREKQRLEALTRDQNEELKTLNASLEVKVQQRTAALKQAHDALVTVNEKLKTSFLTSIKVFSGMVEMRSENLAGHSRRVADLARKIAKKMDLNAQEVQEIFVAGLLHNIGTIGFSDDMLNTPVSMMKGDDLGRYRKHPLQGEQLLTALDDLRGAATILRSQMERFDGEGFPDHSAGLIIPIGARILALASDYDNLQIGTLAQRRLRPDEAINLILQNSGKRYDPQVVKAFTEIINSGLEEGLRELLLTARELRSDMVLSRDLFTNDGLLLLPADHVLDPRLIQQIMAYDVADETRLKVYIRVEERIMRRFLLVDDEINVLHALRRNLRHCIPDEELRIDIFTEPEQALVRCGEVSFDIVISDYRMPNMNGIDFLKMVKTMQPHAVRLVLSASTEFEAVVRAINQAEVFRYIAKPWQADEVAETIRLALARHDELVEDQRLFNELRVQLGELTPQELEAKRLEKEEPGIMKVKWGPDGSVMLDPD